jgi:hypothetical protein
MLFENNKWTINSDNKLTQKNIEVMFVETFYCKSVHYCYLSVK